jgi:hypothetical protein
MAKIVLEIRFLSDEVGIFVTLLSGNSGTWGKQFRRRAERPRKEFQMSPNEIKELKPVAEALNAESNEINQIIKALNAKLATLNVGLEEWLYPDEDHIQIGYAKTEDKWQLSTRSCAEVRWVLNYDAVDENDGYLEPARGTKFSVAIPLLQAPRELRIRALDLDYIPVLIGNLKYKAEQSLKSIRRARKLASEL